MRNRAKFVLLSLLYVDRPISLGDVVGIALSVIVTMFLTSRFTLHLFSEVMLVFTLYMVVLGPFCENVLMSIRFHVFNRVNAPSPY